MFASSTVVAGAVVGISAFTFDPVSVRWISFGGGCAVLSALLVAFALRGRGTAQRVIDLPLALVCVWAVVCSRAIEHAGAGSSPGAIKWFSLAAGAAICGLGTLGLLLHERSVSRDLEWAAQRIQTQEKGHAHAGARTAGQ
jgi:hypothetical protein